jgi:hypothetical protein
MALVVEIAAVAVVDLIAAELAAVTTVIVVVMVVVNITDINQPRSNTNPTIFSRVFLCLIFFVAPIIRITLGINNKK